MTESTYQMRSVQLQKAYERAEEYLKQVFAANPGSLSMFNYWVYLIHEDGTIMHFREAFAVKSKDGWLMVFPEHYDIYVVHVDDLIYYAQFKQLPIEDIE